MVAINPSESQEQKMLSIIYQIPIGLIEADMEGNITAMNAKSVQMLMPLFHIYKLQGNNINRLLEIIAPAVLSSVQQYSRPNGNVIKQLRQEVLLSGNSGAANNLCFLFTVDKLNPDSLTYVFDDVTELYNKEKQLNQMIQDNAIEQLSKFEIASGLLHDIGNAVVSFGAYITKIKRSIEQKNDITTLESLKGFIEKNQEALFVAIGEKKSRAIADLLSGLIANQKNVFLEVKDSITDQMKVISHIQEILNIQRQYVKGHYKDRATINVRDLVNDAVSMLSASFEKKGIVFSLHAPSALLHIKGDRTKLMQVFLNLLKNASDSVTLMESEAMLPLKEINVLVTKKPESVTVTIQDNGRGFDRETGEKLFTRGFTTKTEGTGLGLVNCKSIIESHSGQIWLTSEGPGKGATSTVIFNL
jgi:signal transduction histidine kinase